MLLTILFPAQTLVKEGLIPWCRSEERSTKTEQDDLEECFIGTVVIIKNQGEKTVHRVNIYDCTTTMITAS